MDTKILEDLGLTGAEIKVFIALLEIGQSNAGNVVKKSGLQNAVVHRAFHSLIEKGLVTYIYEGRTKKYQPIEPNQLLNFIDDKKRQLEKLLPALEAKRKLQEKKPNARVFYGIRGIKELLNIITNTKSTKYFSYGGTKKAGEILGDFFWENFHIKRIEKNISAKLLFHPSLKTWLNKLNKLKLTKARLLDKNFEEITETIICNNKVGIIVYSDTPFGFLIEEEKAAKSYKKFFEILWNQAKLNK